MERNVLVSMIISIIFTGLGIAYLGDIKKGICLFLIGVILNIMGMYIARIFIFIGIIVWIISLYLTYKEAQAVNGN